MILSPEAEIAQFLRRLKYILLAGLIGWIVWLLAPILTPFVLALALAWLGDPLVDRIEATGRSRMTGVVLVFVAMVLVITALLLVLVPMIERQITTLIAAAPQAQAWLMEKGIPWFEQKTGLEVMQWMDPDRLIEWVRSHWQQAGGFATTFMGYVSRSGFTVVTWVVNLLLLPILAFYFLRDWDKLVERVAAGTVREVILAVNATVEGQTTAHYLTDQLEGMDVKITRLAHGVPVGGELDYLDEGTLAAALKSRTAF